MRKSIFVIAAIFVATFANAQITLELTLNNRGWVNDRSACVSSGIEVLADAFLVGEYIIDRHYDSWLSTTSMDLYDFNTLDLVKHFDYSSSSINQAWRYLSKNIFTTDGRWSWMEYGSHQLNIVTEDGETLISIPVNDYDDDARPALLKVGNKYKLLVENNIYSLPGNGVATESSEVSAPLRNNALKYLHNDQVLIDSNDRTYTVQGNEVK